LQRRLRNAPYQFARQIGATPEKAKGKGKRPLVVAPIEDRVVQRAILDVLQGAKELPGVAEVIATPTSVGGIRRRSVDDAIAMIQAASVRGDAAFVAGSDIASFFTKVRQNEVADFVREQTDDLEFIDLLAAAMRVELANAAELDPEDLKLFPVGDVGVAQGCPLSAFAGNVALRDFDRKMNGRGVTCLRYIDDFMLFSAKASSVNAAFDSARHWLNGIGMSVYDPVEMPAKAFAGPIGRHFDFLGYQIVPGIYPASRRNVERLFEGLRREVAEGQSNLLRARHSDYLGLPLQLHAQTLTQLDLQLRAWLGSFRAMRCVKTAAEIDAFVDQLVAGFIGFYSEKTKGLTRTQKRRVLGIHVAADEMKQRKLTDAAEAASRR